MHAAWVRCIADGDPGGAPYAPETRTTRAFGTDGTRDQQLPEAARLSLWEGVR
jgi:hypothetical protein